MAIFLTGGNGYLGSYVAAHLLRYHSDRLALLLRARDRPEAEKRLWQGWQPHMSFTRFREYLATRVDIYVGELTEPGFGLSRDQTRSLLASMDSVIHIAASLSRGSARKCFDVNLRGTLEVIQAARAAHELHGLRRFSDVSTTAVAGERSGEVVYEDGAIDWSRRDYDPYARTKKFCEHMLERLLPDVRQTVFRPSMVIGDSRTGQTTQFDMIRAVAFLARMRVLPLSADARQDIVPADYVGRAIADLHQRSAKHRVYHLSAGTSAPTNAELLSALRISGRHQPHVFMPGLKRPFGLTAAALSKAPRSAVAARVAAMMDVFWPYIVFDTVFDNARVVGELGEAPRSFAEYGSAVLDFSLGHSFAYPYRPWPAEQASDEVTSSVA